MSVFRISTILVCCFFLLLFCSAIFIVFVPMDFYSTANGRIVPARSMKVSFPENGIVDFIRQETNFEKGDILARQNTEYEGKMLAVLKSERETLESELAAQTQRSEIDRRKWEVELKKSTLTLEEFTQTIPMQQEQFESFNTMSDSLHAQKKLDEELKKQEAEIIEILYKKQVVAKLDFIKVLHDKKIAEIMSEQAESQNVERIFNYKIELRKLALGQKVNEMEKGLLETPPPPDSAQFAIKFNIQKLELEILALEEKIRNKTFSAPFSGTVLLTSAKKGESLGSREPVMEIAENSRMIFSAVIGQDQRSDVKIGQNAEIYLDNYPSMLFGCLKGSLTDIQTNLSGFSTGYGLEVSLDIPPDKYPPGLSGKANIIIFHGSALKYVLRKKPGMIEEHK